VAQACASPTWRATDTMVNCGSNGVMILLHNRDFQGGKTHCAATAGEGAEVAPMMAAENRCIRRLLPDCLIRAVRVARCDSGCSKKDLISPIHARS